MWAPFPCQVREHGSSVTRSHAIPASPRPVRRPCRRPHTGPPYLRGRGGPPSRLLTKAKLDELRSQPADRAPAEAMGMGSPDLCVRSSRRSTGPDLTYSHHPKLQMSRGSDTHRSRLAGTAVTHFSASPSVCAVSLSVPARMAYCTSPARFGRPPGLRTGRRDGYSTRTAHPTGLDIHPPPGRSSVLRATGSGLGGTHGSPGNY